MIACPRCGVDNTEDSNFCRRCGAHLAVPADSSESTAESLLGLKEGFDLRALDAEGVGSTVLQVLSSGDREGEIVPVQGDLVTIGRSPQSDLFLDDVTVSRHHARIVIECDTYLIEDLNSLNGTYVNRKRIEQHQLFDGDELQIGKFKLNFLQQKPDE
jgi:hypothetical protein